jgi:dihydroorotate dehydrogenase (fumarate)
LLRLRWVAILHGHLRSSLAVTGGVATPADGIKALLAGAHAVQIVSAILRHGPAYFAVMRDGLERWMESHRFATLDDVRGRLSLSNSPDPSAFERATYIRTLSSWDRFSTNGQWTEPQWIRVKPSREVCGVPRPRPIPLVHTV